VKAYAINLARSPARREHITSELTRVGLPYALVDAVDGRLLTQTDISRFADLAAIRRYPRWLTPTTIACAVSHRRAYERVIEDGDPLAFIVEDDVVLPHAIDELLERISTEMHGRDVVLMYYRSFQPCRFIARGEIALKPGVRLMGPMDIRQPISTAAYVITREACTGLLDVVRPVRAGADGWAFFYEQGGFDRLRCVVPRPVGMRTDFKRAIDYLPSGSRRAALASLVDRHRLFPFSQLLALKRWIRELRMSRYEIVPGGSRTGRRSRLTPRRQDVRKADR
jgi:glycosyl transferase, family 25